MFVNEAHIMGFQHFHLACHSECRQITISFFSIYCLFFPSLSNKNLTNHKEIWTKLMDWRSCFKAIVCHCVERLLFYYWVKCYNCLCSIGIMIENGSNWLLICANSYPITDRTSRACVCVFGRLLTAINI